MPTPVRPSEPSAAPNWLAGLRAYLLTVAAANLVWEAVQLPLYTIWRTGTPGKNLFAAIHCTGGDLLIGLVSLTIGMTLVGHRDWPARRFAAVAAITLVTGFGYTVFSEWLNIAVRKNRAYSELMPVLSILGLKLGVSPLLQWTVIPAIALYAGRRAGAARDQGTGPGPPARGMRRGNGLC